MPDPEIVIRVNPPCVSLLNSAMKIASEIKNNPYDGKKKITAKTKLDSGKIGKL